MECTDWIDAKECLPNEEETIDGRVPAIDEDGFLVIALLVNNELITTSEQKATCWMKVHPPIGKLRDVSFPTANPYTGILDNDKENA